MTFIAKTKEQFDEFVTNIMLQKKVVEQFEFDFIDENNCKKFGHYIKCLEYESEDSKYYSTFVIIINLGKKDIEKHEYTHVYEINEIKTDCSISNTKK